MKSYTDINQSKKLAEILPLESADMCYPKDAFAYNYEKEPVCHYSGIGLAQPCWSLASLLEQLPYEICDDEGNSCYLSMYKEDDKYQLVYSDPYCMFDDIETDTYDDFVDACYEMIVKINEQNLL